MVRCEVRQGRKGHKTWSAPPVLLKVAVRGIHLPVSPACVHADQQETRDENCRLTQETNTHWYWKSKGQVGCGWGRCDHFFSFHIFTEKLYFSFYILTPVLPPSLSSSPTSQLSIPHPLLRGLRPSLGSQQGLVYQPEAGPSPSQDHFCGVTFVPVKSQSC